MPFQPIQGHIRNSWGDWSHANLQPTVEDGFIHGDVSKEPIVVVVFEKAFNVSIQDPFWAVRAPNEYTHSVLGTSKSRNRVQGQFPQGLVSGAELSVSLADIL